MPVVPIRFSGLPGRYIGLVDSGAAGTRIPAELAKPLGIDLDDAPTERFAAGAKEYVSKLAPVELQIGKMKPRTMTVAFTAGWYQSHFLLGIRGFFDVYAVTINAAKGPGRTSVRSARNQYSPA